MNLREFGECVEFNIEHNLKHAILGLGAPGIGKSHIIRQIGKKYGYKVIDVRLAQMNEVEIGGLIFPNEEGTMARWLSPENLPDEERDGKNTILLLDEITSCPKRIQVAAYQLILDRRVGQYTLPEGCFVVALGNRKDDDGVYVRLAGPLADRFEIHYIQADLDRWIEDYAIMYGIDSRIIDFLEYNPDAFHTQAEKDKAMLFATPRSWERVSDILKIADSIENTDVINKIIGNLGPVVAYQFLDFIKKRPEIITVDDYLAGAAAPIEIEKIMVLLRGLAQKIGFLKNILWLSELDEEQRLLVENVIKSLFRLKSDEHIIVGLKKILQVNRLVIREIFIMMEDTVIDDFVDKQGKAFRFDIEET